jgi:hypothetical protein
LTDLSSKGIRFLVSTEALETNFSRKQFPSDSENSTQVTEKEISLFLFTFRHMMVMEEGIEKIKNSG